MMKHEIIIFHESYDPILPQRLIFHCVKSISQWPQGHGDGCHTSIADFGAGGTGPGFTPQSLGRKSRIGQVGITASSLTRLESWILSFDTETHNFIEYC